MCNNVGEEFSNINDFFIKLEKIIDKYDNYVQNIDYHILSSDRCSLEYFNIINNL